MATGFGNDVIVVPRLQLTWSTADPGRARTMLAAVGFVPAPDGSMTVAGLDLGVVSGPPPERLLETDGTGPRATAADSIARGGEGVWLRALGWATVDAERLAAAGFGLGADLPDDSLLGARVRATHDPRRILLEPANEGRVAATLARLGEGPAALYLGLELDAIAAVVRHLRELGERPRSGEGPFGRQVVAWRRPPWGPHIVLVVGERNRLRQTALGGSIGGLPSRP